MLNYQRVNEELAWQCLAVLHLLKPVDAEAPKPVQKVTVQTAPDSSTRHEISPVLVPWQL
jgi:hypothetical protein